MTGTSAGEDLLTMYKCIHTGTKKYPDEASYSQFLSAHGGKCRQKGGEGGRREERRERGRVTDFPVFYIYTYREQQCLH